MHRPIITALLASLCQLASAQTPVYAIYGTMAEGNLGTVKSVNVGILPSGKQAECLRQIEVFEAAVRRSTVAGGPELVPSMCVTTLPGKLQPMILERQLKDRCICCQTIGKLGANLHGLVWPTNCRSDSHVRKAYQWNAVYAQAWSG